MDALVKETRFLPALANAIAEWFPLLKGRSIAVADATITRENVPTLPLVAVVFISSTGDQLRRSYSEQFKIIDEFAVQFWMKPERYTDAHGNETPFWSYYPYEYIRDKLLSNLVRWQAPNRENIAYRGMNVQADAMAVTLTFHFAATFDWCADVNETGVPFRIDFNLCTPKACVIEDCVEPEKDECDPCP
ncbi:hypothetical protein [Bradyrhizobium elkanii]|uniref:hypothetical protein n=1 Tax=Bradyrhizobium elkanii TaxID=29448 RepID=UPI0004B24336|nr:hypothetical protein [Bradyrhizobium elkanii]WLA79578.1 hypothetical protein QNJ99_29800 [Bradyrhizobium elkanii]